MSFKSVGTHYINFCLALQSRKSLFTFSTSIENRVLCFRLPIWNKHLKAKFFLFTPCKARNGGIDKKFLFRPRKQQVAYSTMGLKW